MQWEATKLKEGGGRPHEDRFKFGPVIAIYAATATNWTIRAVFCACPSPCPLWRRVQTNDVARGMRGMLALHNGMRVRLPDALDENKTLVKDAEGDAVRSESHADDQTRMENALRMHSCR